MEGRPTSFLDLTADDFLNLIEGDGPITADPQQPAAAGAAVPAPPAADRPAWADLLDLSQPASSTEAPAAVQPTANVGVQTDLDATDFMDNVRATLAMLARTGELHRLVSGLNGPTKQALLLTVAGLHEEQARTAAAEPPASAAAPKPAAWATLAEQATALSLGFNEPEAYPPAERRWDPRMVCEAPPGIPAPAQFGWVSRAG